MILTDNRIFKTRRERNDLFNSMSRDLGLCGSKEDVSQWKEDYKEHLELIRNDDELNEDDIPIYPELMDQVEETLNQLGE